MGFIRARRVTAGTTDTAMFGARAVGGNATRVAFPLAGVINQGTICVPTSPGAGNHTMTVKDNGAVTIGSSLVLTGSQSTRNTINASLPLFDSGTPTNQVRYIRRDDSSAPSQDVQFLFDYSINSDAKKCYIGFGDTSQAFTTTTTNKFQSCDNNGADVSTVESDHQMPWPAAGTFGPFLFTWTLTGTTGTSEVALRINGVDAFVQSLPGQAASLLQVTFLDTSVAVARGDLINLRILRTGSADGSLTLSVIAGFRR